jgi:hypothetical protein
MGVFACPLSRVHCQDLWRAGQLHVPNLLTGRNLASKNPMSCRVSGVDCYFWMG